jgi:hypothetical protein
MTSRVFSQSSQKLLVAIALVVLSRGSLLVHAQTFDSGSNGTDGALNLTTPGTIEFDPKSFNPPLDPDGDNIYHFTTINIAAGVTVRLSAKFLNGSVVWLALEAVQINGTIDLNGETGHPNTNFLSDRKPSLPGAGGYAGGVGGNGNSPPHAGSGPGGGAISFTQPYSGSGGTFTGNSFLIPLIGGSGGGGAFDARGLQFGPGGGAGGGALLIASSIAITVNGTILANGGHGARTTIGGSFYPSGGGGSGGAIRLVAPALAGTGALSVQRGDSPDGPSSNTGRIRLEAFQNTFTGSISPDTSIRTLGSPFALFLPTITPSVRVVSVDGKSVPSNPTGSFTMPDITINKSVAVLVNIAANNIPPGTVVKLYISSENASDQTVDSTPLAGTPTTSTATASVTLPPGFSRGFVRATWTNP